jgi:hypothetical protein
MEIPSHKTTYQLIVEININSFIKHTLDFKQTVMPSELKLIQYVLLKVYDVLGNEVTTLVNEEKPPGEYEVAFDRSKLSSGVYFYKLKSGSYNQIKINKMVLIR